MQMRWAVKIRGRMQTMDCTFSMLTTVFPTACENVEVSTRNLDYLYTVEGSILADYGVEGEGLTYDENGKPQMSELIRHNEKYPCIPVMVLYASYGAPGIYDGSRYMAAYDERTRKALERMIRIGYIHIM